MPTIENNAILTANNAEVFRQLVAKGIHLLLFPYTTGTGGAAQLDTTTNLLYGYRYGTITSGGESVDQEEIADQLAGGSFKSFAGGAIDGGDFTMNTYYNIATGGPQIQQIVDSTIMVPQFFLLMATTMQSDPDKLQVFWAAGVNYNGGKEIKGDTGKAIGSSLKFKISGRVISGTDACGTINKTYYAGSAS
jgi:hypothetical protein